MAVFHAFLTEEWEATTAVAMLQSRTLLTQQAPVTCIQYREPTRGEGGTAWACLAKAIWIADCCMGARPAAVQDGFVKLLRLNTVQARHVLM